MRGLLYALSAFAVMALAFWAYHENYSTQEAQARAEKLQSRIARARQDLRMLQAEWAYLNRPERLEALAAMHFDRLGLLPMRPHQFGQIDQVAYPPVAPLRIENPTDVISLEEPQP